MEKIINVFESFKNIILEKLKKNVHFDEELLNEELFILYFDVKECAKENNDHLANILLKLFDNQKFEEIEPIFLEYIKTTSLSDDILAEYYFNFARYKSLLLEFEDAERFFNLAYQKSLKNEQTKLDFKFTDELIRILIKLENLNDIEKILKNLKHSKFEFVDELIYLYLDKKEYEKAEKILQKIEEIYKDKENIFELANLERLKGEIKLEKKDFNSAEQILTKTFEMIKNTDFYDMQILLLNHLIFISENNQDFDLSLKYIDIQIKLINDNDLSVNQLLHSLLKKSQIYEKLNQINQAIHFLHESLNLIDDYSKIPETFDSDINDIKTYLYHNLAELYFQIQQNNEAIEYFNKTLEIAQKTKIKLDYSTVYFNLAFSYFENQKPDKALNILQKIDIDSKNQNQNQNIQQQFDILFLFARIYENKNNLKESAKYAEKALKLAQNAETEIDEFQKILLQGLLAILYSQLEQHTKSIELLKIVLDYYEKSNVKNLDFVIYIQALGVEYLQTNRNFEGLKELFKALDLANQILKDDKIQNVVLASIYSDIGFGYTEGEMNDIALANYQISLDLLKKDQSEEAKIKINEIQKIMEEIRLEKNIVNIKH